MNDEFWYMYFYVHYLVLVKFRSHIRSRRVKQHARFSLQLVFGRAQSKNNRLPFWRRGVHASSLHRGDRWLQLSAAADLDSVVCVDRVANGFGFCGGAAKSLVAATLRSAV